MANTRSALCRVGMSHPVGTAGEAQYHQRKKIQQDIQEVTDLAGWLRMNLEEWEDTGVTVGSSSFSLAGASCSGAGDGSSGGKSKRFSGVSSRAGGGGGGGTAGSGLSCTFFK